MYHYAVPDLSDRTAAAGTVTKKLVMAIAVWLLSPPEVARGAWHIAGTSQMRGTVGGLVNSGCRFGGAVMPVTAAPFARIKVADATMRRR